MTKIFFLSFRENCQENFFMERGTKFQYKYLVIEKMACEELEKEFNQIPKITIYLQNIDFVS